MDSAVEAQPYSLQGFVDARAVRATRRLALVAMVPLGVALAVAAVRFRSSPIPARARDGHAAG